MEEASAGRDRSRRSEAPGRDRAAWVRRRPWVTDLPRQLAIAGCGALVYACMFVVIEWLYPAGSKRQVAIENGERVVRLERYLHLFNEQRLQHFTQSHGLLRHLLDGVYLYAHLPLIVVLAVWLYAYHRPGYNLVRNAFLVSGGLALICELYPVAPPHMLPDLQLANTIVSRVYDIVEPKGFFDPYGAVPSIHASWSLLLAIVIWRVTDKAWLRGLAALLPLAMTVAVIATGNHYWFDVFTGVIAALIGLWLGAWTLHVRQERIATVDCAATTATVPLDDGALKSNK